MTPMALRITDFNGIDLSEQPPARVNVAADPISGGVAALQCLVIEDGTLPYQYVTGTINWNDGNQPVVYNGNTASTLTIDTNHSFQPGNYTVKVEAHNYVTPAWDYVSVNFQFTVRSTDAVPVGTPIIYGPILPRDTGYPNPNQWSWNTGKDVEILASSVKMLLTTSKGERIMQPEYGTNLRLLLFEFTTGIESLVQQEIIDALTKWEPRVSLQFLTVEKTGERAVTVYATFVSKLNQQDFMIPMVFNP